VESPRVNQEGGGGRTELGKINLEEEEEGEATQSGIILFYE
jgi:hypothetical protein